MVDITEGTSRRGVLRLTLIVTDGGEGEGGRGIPRGDTALIGTGDGERAVERRDGSVEGAITEGSTMDGTSKSDRASNIEELMEIDDTEEGERERVMGDSADIGVGDGILGESDALAGVGVNDGDGDEGIDTPDADDSVLISVMGVRRVNP
ncbi:hypothetical protein BKA93DRAFT_760217 [Sparassis latifolia]